MNGYLDNVEDELAIVHGILRENQEGKERVEWIMRGGTKMSVSHVACSRNEIWLQMLMPSDSLQ